MTENGPQELRDANGNVVGYFVPAADFAHLLKLQNDLETVQNQLDAALPVATPEEEAEMATIMATAVPLDLEEIIREIETAEGR